MGWPICSILTTEVANDHCSDDCTEDCQHPDHFYEGWNLEGVPACAFADLIPANVRWDDILEPVFL